MRLCRNNFLKIGIGNGLRSIITSAGDPIVVLDGIRSFRRFGVSAVSDFVGKCQICKNYSNIVFLMGGGAVAVGNNVRSGTLYNR